MVVVMQFVRPNCKEHPTWETEYAERMFEKFVTGEFSYDELSSRADCLVYASAQVLAIILLPIIEEMLARKDRENFLIYPLLTALDPVNEKWPDLAERVHKMVPLINRETTDKIYQLLEFLSDDPPLEEDRFTRIKLFWNSKKFAVPAANGPQP